MFRTRGVIDAWEDALAGSRAAQRTGVADRALADGSDPALRDLGLTLRRRERAICSVSNAQGSARREMHGNDWTRAITIILGFIALVVATGFLFGGQAAGGVAFVVIIVLALMDGGKQTRSRNHHLRWLAQQCPECGYALSGLDEVAPERTAFVQIGPRACPECGLAWPMIPPAMSEERS